jgi:hypothetical protein
MMTPNESFKPEVLSDDGQIVTVRTAQGDQVPLSKANPQHQQMLSAFGYNLQQPAQAPASAPLVNGGEITPEPVARAPMAQPQMQQPPMAMQMTSKSESQSERKKISPEAQRKLDEAEFHTVSAIKQQAEAEQKKAAAQNLIESNNVMELQHRNDEIMAKEQVRQEEGDRLRSEIATKAQEYGDMKVDPDFFGRLDTGNKIMAGIAIALGGLGQAYQGPEGKENMGLSMVMKAADRDIEAQKSNIGIKKDALAAKRGAFQDFLSITQDERAAELAEKTRILDIYKAQLNQVTSSNANDIIKANAAKEIAGVEATQAKLGAELNQTIEKRATARATEVGPNKAAKLEMVPESVAKDYNADQEAIRQLREIRDLAALNKDGTLGPIDSAMSQMARKLGISDPNPAALRAKVQQAIQNRIYQISGTTASKQQMEAIKETLPQLSDNPATFFKILGDNLKQVETSVKSTEKAYSGLRQLPNRVIDLESDLQAQKDKYRSGPTK